MYCLPIKHSQNGLKNIAKPYTFAQKEYTCWLSSITNSLHWKNKLCPAAQWSAASCFMIINNIHKVHKCKNTCKTHLPEHICLKRLSNLSRYSSQQTSAWVPSSCMPKSRPQWQACPSQGTRWLPFLRPSGFIAGKRWFSYIFEICRKVCLNFKKLYCSYVKYNHT